MAQAGILSEDDRVELIQGEIVQMTRIGSGHAGCVNRLTQMFVRRLGDRALVSVQNPIVIGHDSEPQPDVVILRPRADAYADHHPTPESILLVIEVADTTLAYDRSVKLPLYAAAAIPEVWIVDLTGRAIEIHRAPSSGRYTDVHRKVPGEALTPAAFLDCLVQVVEILG
jgi:Uma2 family endonuclease